jgi:hypothetical protein
LHLAGSNFTHSLQDHHRDAVLNFQNDTILIDFSNITMLDGTTTLDTAISMGTGYKALVRLALTGTSNLETSDTVVYANEWQMMGLYDAAGNPVSSSDPAYTTIEPIVNSMTVEGYELEAYRTNSNRRTRGQMVKVDRYNYIYVVSPVGPLSVIKPFNDARDDAADLATLISIVKIKASNDAVTRLERYAKELRTTVNTNIVDNVDYKLATPSTYLVRPYYAEETIDMTAVVDSLRSTDRAEDIRNALLLRIRDHAYRMASDTAYTAALEVYYGSNPPTPTVIVGTNSVIARYLTDLGDLKSVGLDFNMVVVSSLDNRLSNPDLMYITFGVFDENRNTKPNPLNFGYTAWTPEVTVVVPISRNNTISKELTVDPRYRHIPLLPILAKLEVQNLNLVLNKVTLNNST